MTENGYGDGVAPDPVSVSSLLQLQPPPIINTVLQKAEELWNRFSEPALSLMLKAAIDGAQVWQYLDEIIRKARSYLDAWVTAPAAVNHVADEWGILKGNLNQALEQCQGQVSYVQTYWSGTAAHNFNLYTQDLLPLLQSAYTAFNNVRNDLASMADKLGNLNATIENGGADLAIMYLNDVFQLTDKALLVGAGSVVDPLLGVTVGVNSLVQDMVSDLSQALEKLSDTFSAVEKLLYDIQSVSTSLQTEVQLHFPSEPAGLSNPSNWSPD